MMSPHGGSRSEFRRHLAQLADGTRTTKEMAEILGKPQATVSSALTYMKKNGANIARASINHEKTDRNDQIFSDRQDGMTFKKIGLRHGITGARASHIIAKVERKRRRENT